MQIFFINFASRCKQSDTVPHYLPLVSLTPVANLPPVVHLHCEYLRIFEKVRNNPIVILRGLGKMIHEKNTKAKNLVMPSL